MKHLLYLLILATCIYKVQGQDFEVAPVKLNFNANPGEIQTKKITLRNHHNKKQAFTFTIGDYQLDSEGKKTRLPAGTSKRSLADWITVSPSFIELNPNEEFQIDVIITVPNNGYSTRWGMLYVQATQEQKAGNVDKELAAGIKLVPRIVVMLSQSPKSNNNYKASVSNLREITAPEDSLRTFAVDVQNVGDKIVEAKVYLALADLQTAKEKKFEPVKATVFPDQVQTINLTLPDQNKKGKFVLAAILDYGHRSALEGTQITIEIP